MIKDGGLKSIITFDDYDKVSDTILTFKNGLIIGFITELGYVDKDGNKRPMTTEIIHTSKSKTTVTVKRRFNGSLYLQYFDESETFGKGMFKITPSEIMIDRMNIVDYTDKYIFNAKMYVRQDKNSGKYRFKRNVKDTVLYGAYGKQITLKPTKPESNGDDTYEVSTLITFNNSVTVELDKRELLSLSFILTDINMLNYANEVASSYGSTRIGKNICDLSNSRTSRDPSLKEEVKTSYFDKKRKSIPVTEQEKKSNFFDD